MTAAKDFIALNLCVLTVSDTRTADNDTSGDYLCDALGEAGHRLHARAISGDDKYRLRALVSAWIAESEVHGILVTGGTGFTGRDSTPEALRPLLDKEMPGFGEMFRVLSFEEIGTSTLQSRAFAGLANDKFLFCLPGSTSACRTAWEKLLRAQLDSRTAPCNLAGLRPRLRES
ncbi:MAG: molybdenum cofactor biosynthesis protein B [Rudaea sp.]|uniref:molybdenum cofactor biosynthesis protein B n=1 Tax=unclassified Rudaea TaxID=2627037 RepID=UPI0010F52023|nr:MULTISPECIES: molybdenum cofactor biosynthesis protein B [unclassified Rudaea]MBN8885773.1 molybdenum cofactor biosynthesis protein B [Rudaea sp.]MBR0345524.1 molybdenum cofactor biosynthesis protein B [Rudaea sp.]